MKICPVCREQFEDDLQFCTFDGAPLPGTGLGSPKRSRHTTEAGTYNSIGSARNGWKTAFFVLLVTVLAGAGVGSFFLLKEQQRRQPLITDSSSVTTTTPPRERDLSVVAQGDEKPGLLSELTRQELMERLPNNLLRRFHAGEPGQGTPDDLRVLSSEKGEYVAMVGTGKLEGGRTAVERMLVLKYDQNDFRDATREVLPPAYGSGAVTGAGAQVKFDEAGNNIVVRESRSSSSIVQSCASCRSRVSGHHAPVERRALR